MTDEEDVEAIPEVKNDPVIEDDPEASEVEIPTTED